jgi:hypothetical protein
LPDSSVRLRRASADSIGMAEISDILGYASNSPLRLPTFVVKTKKTYLIINIMKISVPLSQQFRKLSESACKSVFNDNPLICVPKSPYFQYFYQKFKSHSND